MKRLIISGIMCCSSLLCAMEVELWKKVESVTHPLITYEMPSNIGPKLVLIKDTIYKRTWSQPADITVAGKMEQDVIQGFVLENRFVAGDIYKSQDNGVFFLDPVFKKYFNYCFRTSKDPMSMTVKGKIFNVSNSYDYIDRDSAGSDLVFVIEPMVDSTKGSYAYTPYRRMKRDDGVEIIVKEYYYELKALEEAEKDLSIGCRTVLKRTPELFAETWNKKSIAFPLLSAVFGMPRDIAACVMVASVINCIKNKLIENMYKEIQFVVEKEEDFELYKIFLNDYWHSMVSGSGGDVVENK